MEYDNSTCNGNLNAVLDVKNDATNMCDDSSIGDDVPLLQKLVAEVVGTFLLIFVGCGCVVTNLNNDNVVTLPGIAIVWGLCVMVLAYSLGHISGAHFNPAVTIAHASTKRFPLEQVPPYIIAQFIGSLLASGALKLIFSGKENRFVGTVPAGSNLQAFVIELIITFYLMFIISGVATDDRAIGELAGLAVGSVIILNVLFAGPITGASMNPVRSLGPAIVHHEYRGIWIYVVAPILGALAGTWAYTFIRITNKSVHQQLTKSCSFLKNSGSK
ncbi:aquaporin NIP1-2 [Lathyrus oleraceus]|uniref:Aquaporin NIP1-2 n=1 Tax=Pisum sativum TaxID=3888 RepID=A0A9D5BQ76_PEA|nr:aquaporin NIP1-2-like [Pisum sativum]KAI5447711.1 Aquaporin NIP1-2 [Pisum sativum]